MHNALRTADEDSLILEALHAIEVELSSEVDNFFHHFRNVEAVYCVLVAVVTSHAGLYYVRVHFEVLVGLGELKAVCDVLPKGQRALHCLILLVECSQVG